MKILILGFLLITACSHHRHNHDHNHQHAKHDLTLNQGQKWKTDSILRAGMENIHTGLIKLMNKETSDKAKEKDYLGFYDLVQKNTQGIIENCKMSPEMDSAYHVILEEMLSASEELKIPTKRKMVTKRFVKAFHQYQDHFDQSFGH